MFKRSVVGVLFCIVFSINVHAIGNSAECSDVSNPYNLTLECELSEGLPEAVQRFWVSFPGVRYFKGAGDVNIAYRAFEQVNKSKAIVISSGRTETFDKYKELIFDFYNLGYSVFIYDHRGQGYSDRLVPGEENRMLGHVNDFDNFVADFDIFLEQVVLPTKHSEYFLFTHSMGGAVAMLYLAEAQREVFSAVAHSSPMVRANTGVPFACTIVSVVSWFCDTCLTPKTEYASLEQELEEGGLTHSMVRYKLRKEAYSNPQLRLGPATFGWVDEACKSANDIEKSSHQISTPSLILQAGLDSLVLPEAQQQFCASLDEPLRADCGPHLYPGAKHEFFIEVDEYRIPALTQVLDFFQKHSLEE